MFDLSKKQWGSSFYPLSLLPRCSTPSLPLPVLPCLPLLPCSFNDIDELSCIFPQAIFYITGDFNRLDITKQSVDGGLTLAKTSACIALYGCQSTRHMTNSSHSQLVKKSTRHSQLVNRPTRHTVNSSHCISQLVTQSQATHHTGAN